MSRQHIYTIGIALAVPMSVFAQQSLESRIAQLEQRVQVLEQRLESTTSQVHSNRPAISTATTGDSRTSGYAVERTPQSPVATKRTYPITVRLSEKSLEKAGPGEQSDRLGFRFEFQNIGSEHITSFSGLILLQNMDGEVLAEFPFDMATYVTAGDKTGWFSSIPFSAVNKIHRILLTATVESLPVNLRLHEVMYYDTRIERFE